MEGCEFFKKDLTVTLINNVWNGLLLPRSNHMEYRPFHGLVLTMNDPRIYRFDNPCSMELLTSPGTILYLPKESSYRLDDVSPCDCISINFSILESTEVEPQLYRTGADTTILTTLFRTASEEWNTRTVGYGMRIRSILYEVLWRMQRGCSTSDMNALTAERIRESADYIGKQYIDPGLSVAQLAERSGICETYYRRCFAELFGMSPLQYIRSLRIRRAQELLESDMYSVKETAVLSGYTGESYFSRDFRRVTGITPLQYRHRSKT